MSRQVALFWTTEVIACLLPVGWLLALEGSVLAGDISGYATLLMLACLSGWTLLDRR